MSKLPVIDMAAIERLQEWGGLDLPQKMVGIFLAHTADRLAQIQSGLAAKDHESAATGAHSLKSSAGNVGATQLQVLCQEAEIMAEAGDFSSLKALLPDLESAYAATREELRRIMEGFGGMRPTIAVVEDNPDNRLLVQALLEDLYEIQEYETGVAAVEGLALDIPDLVLLDISLPEMDGSEVLEWIRAQEELEGLPVIALTAHAMTGDREKYLGQGFNDYLTKPIIDETLLLETIARWLTPEE